MLRSLAAAAFLLLGSAPVFAQAVSNPTGVVIGAGAAVGGVRPFCISEGPGGQCVGGINIDANNHLLDASGSYVSTGPSATARTFAARAAMNVDIEDFGGKADSTPGTIDGTDNSAAMDRIFALYTDATGNFGHGFEPGFGLNIRFHGGTHQAKGKCYGFSRTIDLGMRHGVNLVGDSALTSCVTVSGNYPILRSSAGSYANPPNRQGARGLTFYCSGPGGSPSAPTWGGQQTGIDFRYVYQGDIRDNAFRGCNIPLYFVGMFQTHVDHNMMNGAGANLNNYCVYMDVPSNSSDAADAPPNNGIIATANECFNPHTEGLRWLDASGSLFTDNQWLGGVHGVHGCDLPSTTPVVGGVRSYVTGAPARCEFVTFMGDQTDTTSAEGWFSQQGFAAQFHDIVVGGATWTGNSYSVGQFWAGLTNSSIDFVHIETADIGFKCQSCQNNKITGNVANYNRASNGSAAVLLDGSSSNAIFVHAATTTASVGYNGIVEQNNSANNPIYGSGLAACQIALQFGGSGTATYSTQSCAYSVEGMKVSLQFYDVLTALGGATGGAQLFGLPLLTAAANSGYGFGATSQVFATTGVSSVSGSIIANAVPNSTAANLVMQGATGSTAMSNTNFSNTTTLVGSISYLKQ